MSATQPLVSYSPRIPLPHISLLILSLVTSAVVAPRGNILWHVLICDLQGHLSVPQQDLGWQLTLFIPPSLISLFAVSLLLLPPPPPPCYPLLISLSGGNYLKNTIKSETSVVGNQLTFTSILSPRLRTWMWLKRSSAWCWKSSTPAYATLCTTTPTWCMRCSTRGSSLSSSGCTHPSRTSCRTWTRSVCVCMCLFCGSYPPE